MRIMDMWIAVYQKGNSVAGYLSENGISKVVIYGMSLLGTRLFEELRNSNVDVLYGIDNDPHIYTANVDIHCLDDVPNERPDMVIVTAMQTYEQVYQNLISKGYIRIKGLDDILFEVLTK